MLLLMKLLLMIPPQQILTHATISTSLSNKSNANDASDANNANDAKMMPGYLS